MTDDPHASAELLRESHATIDHLKGQIADLTDSYMETHEQLLRACANIAILVGWPIPRLPGDPDHIDPTQIPSHIACSHMLMFLNDHMGEVIRNEMRDYVASATGNWRPGSTETVVR